MMGRGLQMDRQDWNGKADILGRGFISNSGSKEFCIGRNTGSSEAIDTKRTYIAQKILDCHQIEPVLFGSKQCFSGNAGLILKNDDKNPFFRKMVNGFIS